jgi:hypothetical protein
VVQSNKVYLSQEALLVYFSLVSRQINAIRYSSCSMRFLFLVHGMLALASCSMAVKPYTPPVDQVLQEPLPGHAIAYLLRAPHDDIDIELFAANKKLAGLREGTYTVICLAPGTHVITTRGIPTFGNGIEAAPSFQVIAKSGERRFFNISGAITRTLGIFGGVPIAGTGVMAGSRSWKEVSELDAQGLMSISRLVLPEQGAL